MPLLFRAARGPEGPGSTSAAPPSFFRSLLVFAIIPTYMVLASLVFYPVARILGSPRLLYSLGRLGVRMALFLGGVHLVIEGRERLRDTRNAVVVANHQSLLDAPVVFEALRVDFKAAVKKELFRIPFFGWCLRYAGFIEVDRSNSDQATRAIQRAVKTLKEGACFVVFPEGTRSLTGELGPFKKGGFVVAMDAGSRILPVAICGTRELLPKGTMRLRSGTVTVRVLDPVDAGGYSYENRDALIAAVRSQIAAALESGGGDGRARG